MTAVGSRGYTLIELVLVIVIAGILAHVAGSRFFSQPVFAQRGFTEELGAALRLAQKTAVSSECSTQVTVTASTYAVAQQAASAGTCNSSDTTWTTAVVGMDGQAASGTAPTGITVSPTGKFVFSGTSAVPGGIPGAITSYPATTLAIGTDTITVDAVTGYVQVN
jgi:MSHA pilin protein MshC